MTERRSINEKLTIGSLFSGIGGIELGLERTGYFKTKWQCEIDEYARKVLAKHWPGIPIYKDVKELCETEFPEPVDVLCGGFPCQPFSAAGRRKGEKDERYLWPEFIRIIRHIRPRWIVAENVPGVLTIDSGRVFGRILRDLAECGYYVEWDTISAASVGALHPRNRVFIVAHSDNERRRAEQIGECRSSHPAVFRNDGEEKALANAESEGGECWPTQEREQHPQCGDGISGRSGSGIFGRPPEPRTDWAIEPDVGRVANGIPHRVDRLRCLGNAVVPQCAQYIGERIIEFERGPIMTHEVEWIDEKEDR